MSSVLRRRRLALALATAVTFGLPATAGAMPAGPDPPAGDPSGAPASRMAPLPPAEGGDATLAIVLVSGGLLAAVAGSGAAYVASRHPRAVRLG